MDEVTREVELDSDPERAWQAISEQSELSEWLGGEVTIDLRPGGDLRVREEDAERTGFVEEVDQGRRLSFWWSYRGQEATRVELEVTGHPSGVGSTVRVTESRPLAGLERELADITALATTV